jgi:hypothetical protein
MYRLKAYEVAFNLLLYIHQSLSDDDKLNPHKKVKAIFRSEEPRKASKGEIK